MNNPKKSPASAKQKHVFSFPALKSRELSAAEARAGAASGDKVLITYAEPINSSPITMSTQKNDNQELHPLTMHKTVHVAENKEEILNVAAQPVSTPQQRPDLLGGQQSVINSDEPEVVDETKTRIVEKVIVEKSGGGFSIGKVFRILTFPFRLVNGIRQIITTGCFLLLAIVAVFLVTIIFKPPVLWNPFKAFLNAEVAVPAKSPVTLEKIYEKIAADGVTNKKVSLNEQELMVLLGQQVKVGTDFRIDMEENNMRLLVNTEEEANPLWLLADITATEGSTKITKIGFNRVSLPDGVNNFISDQLFRVLDVTKQQLSGNASGQIFSNALDESRIPVGLTIKEVKLQKDKVEIEFNYKSDSGF